MRRLTIAALLVIAPLPLIAQAGPAVTAARDQWKAMTTYIARAADQMSEADFAFRPVASVRTFGQMVGHVAGSQRMYCAVALGEKPPAENAVEKSATTKAALVQAMKETTSYCERAYAQSDAQAAAAATVFGQKTTRLGVLVQNAAHNAEHYGNIVTYMRIKGKVPPSSQGQ